MIEWSQNNLKSDSKGHPLKTVMMEQKTDCWFFGPALGVVTSLHSETTLYVKKLSVNSKVQVSIAAISWLERRLRPESAGTSGFLLCLTPWDVNIWKKLAISLFDSFSLFLLFPIPTFWVAECIFKCTVKYIYIYIHVCVYRERYIIYTYIWSNICYNSTRLNESIIGVVGGGVPVDVLGIKWEGSGWKGDC